MAKKPGTRAQEILQALARMLEKSGGGRITTAALAAELGVSEAALYRHFPSKTRMYEGLIDFIEDTVFARVRGIISDEPNPVNQCYRILSLVLAFAEKHHPSYLEPCTDWDDGFPIGTWEAYANTVPLEVAGD